MATAFVTVIAIAIVGATMTGRTMAAFLGQSEPSTGLWLEQKKTVLGASFVIRLMMLIGIVFLMAVKPATWAPSLATVVAAAVIGVLAGMPKLQSQRIAAADDASPSGRS